MPQARKSLISLEATPYYHCVSRCVRRAFLCGVDALTGASYEHRRGWVEEKLLALPEVFAIEVCAYAVMSNHFHVVLHVDAEEANGWETREVIERWHRLFKGTYLSQRYMSGDAMTQAERDAVSDTAEQWRQRLMDVSWFMRVINESVARQANQEDGCSGRFWEGRFKSQALLDEKALAACMAYVDLNPIRAKLAKTAETSDHTSIKRRINNAKTHGFSEAIKTQPSSLSPFAGNPRQRMPKGIPMRLNDYLQLADWTGRILRDDKRGAIPEHLPPLLERLQIEPKQWLYMTRHFESRFKGLVGAAHQVQRACRILGFQRRTGLAGSRLFKPVSEV